ncbi:hypothetical protein EST92_09875 [Streptomyces sp. TM32]|nr:hypothetical protein EST92_09875 [Streptomyces sp. TM32]
MDASASQGGRPATRLRPRPLRQHNTAERCINRLKRRRGIATRQEKTVIIHLAGLHNAGLFLSSTR